MLEMSRFDGRHRVLYIFMFANIANMNSILDTILRTYNLYHNYISNL